MAVCGVLLVQLPPGVSLTVPARASVAIGGVTRAERDHLLREEITQFLGAFNDAPDAPTSIFYAEWSETPAYDPVDAGVLSALYSVGVRPGMGDGDVQGVLHGVGGDT